MQLGFPRDPTKIDIFKLKDVAEHFPKLEYIAMKDKPTKDFIDTFLLKLPNLKYFSFQTKLIEYQSCNDDDLIDFFTQNLPYPVETRELTAEGRPISPDCPIYSKELSILSQNFIESIYFYDESTLLFVKKLNKKRDSYTIKYFAYKIKKDQFQIPETTIRIVFEN